MKSTTLRSLAVYGAAVVLAAAVLLAAATARGQTGTAGTAGLPWSVLGAGGGHSSAATYSLDGTLGQPLSDSSAGGAYQLASGFWQEDAGYHVYMPQLRR